ncbi:MAG TPA: pyridine nucleotide-disulfide oxidoreductase, partial [Gammaproteobacteria bacterium]|nr:pyridine nucleotide-disulfide oxidoreductase [Gammaproteobacteria bacterium]
DERLRAKRHHEKPDFIKLIRAWGGITIVYRRTMQESPAYTHNHEELQKAFEEGIYYREALEPAEVILNAHGECETLVCHRRQKNPAGEWESTQDAIRLPARSIFVATGTQPNIAYEFEHRGTFNRVGVHYQHYENQNDELIVAHGIKHCKEPDFGPFTSYQKNDHRVSLIGDTHPVFHGNVVKAIASGMRTYPKILESLHQKLGQRGDEKEYQQFSEKMTKYFSATVKKIERLSKNIIELTIEAPLASKHFKPGHFYRLQNYETIAPRVKDTILQMEPLALVASDCDRETGILKFIVIEKGVSSSLCALLKVGEPVSLMGPTGIRAKISNEQETVLVIIDEMGLPFLHAYGTALREKGNHVICLALFNHPELIKQAADIIIPSTAERGIDDLISHAGITLADVDRIYLITDTPFLKKFQAARATELKTHFVKDPVVHASVYSTMQCMLKGVCAQCLQWQMDPETGKRTKAVFACSWPLQPLEVIDLDNIDERQSQNRLQETLNQMWLDFLRTTENMLQLKQ